MPSNYVGVPGNTSAHDLPVDIVIPLDTEVNTAASILVSIEYLADRMAFLETSALLLDQGTAELVTGKISFDSGAVLRLLAGSEVYLDATSYGLFDTEIDCGANFQFNHVATNTDMLFDPATGRWLNQVGFRAEEASQPTIADSAYDYDATRTVAGKILDACDFQCEQNNGVAANGIFVATAGTAEMGYWIADLVSDYKVQATFRAPIGATLQAAKFCLENTSGSPINVTVKIFRLTRKASPTPGTVWDYNTSLNTTTSVAANTVAWQAPTVGAFDLTEDQTALIEVTLPSGGDIKFFGVQMDLLYSKLNPEV